MNSIVLLGRTTSAIELKTTSSGKYVTNFSLAVKRPYAKDVTDFHNIVAWGNQAEILSKHVPKGTMICLVGYLQNRSWEDSEGRKKTISEVVMNSFSFCESKKNTEGNSLPTEESGAQGNVGAYTAGDFVAVDDEDLPF